VPIQQTLERLAQVLDEMEPIRHLQGLRRAPCCAIGIRAGAVPADNLDARMCVQPLFEQLRGENGKRSMG
jgi:hypothetical protein